MKFQTFTNCNSHSKRLIFLLYINLLICTNLSWGMSVCLLCVRFFIQLYNKRIGSWTLRYDLAKSKWDAHTKKIKLMRLPKRPFIYTKIVLPSKNIFFVPRHTIVADYYGFTLTVRVSVRPHVVRPSVFSFPDENLSRYKWILPNLVSALMI